MRTLQVKLTGIVPLLMHSSKLVDKNTPIVREMGKITAKGSKKQTDADRDRLAELEFLGGLWLDETKKKPAIPTLALEACFKEGARAARRGKDAERAMFVDGECVPLKYNGPGNLEKLWENREQYAFTVPAVVNKARVMRTRPIFREWSATFECSYDETEMNESSVKEAWIEAGRRGLGDWRPKFGRFNVEFGA